MAEHVSSGVQLRRELRARLHVGANVERALDDRSIGCGHARDLERTRKVGSRVDEDPDLEEEPDREGLVRRSTQGVGDELRGDRSTEGDLDQHLRGGALRRHVVHDHPERDVAKAARRVEQPCRMSATRGARRRLLFATWRTHSANAGSRCARSADRRWRRRVDGRLDHAPTC